MGKIIAFAGRCRSGKSELASICEKKGFEKIYFALPLKRLCADILHMSIDELNKAKNEGTNINLHFNYDVSTILSMETGIPLKQVIETCYDKRIDNVREMLQFIGTDLIRKYNTNWHVERIREMIDKDKNYVIDDVRFPNELNLVRELGGDCWFIIRPIINNVSNHESETSLTLKDFGDKIIINDGGLNVFKFKWETFFSEYDKSLEKRNKYINSRSVSELYDVISEPLSVFELLEMSIYLFKYKRREFNCSEFKNITQDNDLTVDIEYKDGSHEYIKNPLNIEDLKICL